ncbi:hypothetical protein BU23DRAFT_556428 [Bimuria novae-zelandiae CBS 107.79]|uniref:Uncharacterized protein n=1 Tax=Bimuria novae-zelandiae CBS 107.79 TaxID=1447943 RepID=A0A6A5V101_9PLEO|nr:hypothetical protein BU23DRAFT_556428 [Bimuria novae-zelandiae CBS 107.79]
MNEDSSRKMIPPGITIDIRRAKDIDSTGLKTTTEIEARIRAGIQAHKSTKYIQVKGI